MKKKQRKVRKQKKGGSVRIQSKASIDTTAEDLTWIRIDQKFPLPSYIKNAIQKLTDNGFVAYIVGGSVRDYLLGRICKDHDIATNAKPEELEIIFPNAITVGKIFGVIKIPCKSEILEIATFREDRGHQDHRHPKKIAFRGVTEDAKRRDFTINALFFDPKTQRVLDVTGGLEDLNRRLIRAIGEPSIRFQEDALRLLRAIRFATLLQFHIETETLRGIKKRFRLLGKISKERIQQEMNLMLTGPSPHRALEMLSESNLILEIIPEIEWLKSLKQPFLDHPDGNAWKHTLKCLQLLSKIKNKSLALCWAVLLHEIKKPMPTIRDPKNPSTMQERDNLYYIKQICERLKLSNEVTDTVLMYISELSKFKEVYQMREATLQRWLLQDHFEELLELHRMVALSTDGNLAFYEFCYSRYSEIVNSPQQRKLIDGEDLIQLGFEPGPQFTQILKTVEDLTFEQKLTTKEDALEFVVKYFVS